MGSDALCQGGNGPCGECLNIEGLDTDFGLYCRGKVGGSGGAGERGRVGKNARESCRAESAESRTLLGISIGSTEAWDADFGWIWRLHAPRSLACTFS